MVELEKNGLRIIAFAANQDFYYWLSEHADSSPGIWIRIYKKASGRQSVAWAGAVEVALCFGWIDSLVNTYDDESYIQKFTPRRPKGMWSKINCETVGRLIADGRMRPAGLAQVEAAKTDGRWDAAYESPKNMQVPADFIEELNKHPKAEAFYATLNKTNRYSIAFRLTTARKLETRQRRQEVIIALLNEGKKLV